MGFGMNVGFFMVSVALRIGFFVLSGMLVVWLVIIRF